jgi:tetratricopeptide (TPR) repeat protein
MNVKIEVSIALIVFLMVGMGYTQEKGDPEQFRQANASFEEGGHYFLQGKMKKAQQQFQQGIDRMPQHADSHFFLAQIFYQKKSFKEARHHIEAAIGHFEAFKELYLANHKEYLQKLGEQKVKIRDKIELDRYNIPLTPSCIRRGQMSAEISKDEDRVSLIGTELSRPLPDLTPKLAEYHYVYGNILYKSREHRQSALHYLEAIRLNPRHRNAYHNLAGLYQMAGAREKAAEILERARENGIEADEKLRQAILGPPKQEDARAHFSQSRAFYETGDFYKALIHIRKAKECLAPAVPADYYLLHGNILLKLKRYPEARQQYRLASRLKPELKTLTAEKTTDKNLK